MFGELSLHGHGGIGEFDFEVGEVVGEFDFELI